jgi:EAL and modified HD-GYP domain-containing signal transduction protein
MPAIVVPPQIDPLQDARRTAPSPSLPNRFLGRQPILDAERRLFGYELFYRAGKTDHFSGDPELATREVVDHWLMLIPDENQGVSFVNCTRTALLDGLVTLLPPESTVLEILEDIDPDPEVVNCCLSLKARGYRFALDGFMPRPSRAPFLALTDFIKVDFSTAHFLARREIYALASGTQARLVAEKIETDKQLSTARTEGCTLFQGYFFSQPVLVESPGVPRNNFVYLNLLAQLHRGPSDLRKLEKIISADASLCFRMLRLANSALMGHPGVVATIHEALLMVGEDSLRRMVTVAMASAVSGQRSPALLAMILTRARFCELLAPSLGEDPAHLYLLGMLSLLDVLLQTPLRRILEILPIGQPMKMALAGDQSPAGLALDLIRSLERCDWARCEAMQHRLQLADGAIAAAYTQSLHRAAAMTGANEAETPPS